MCFSRNVFLPPFGLSLCFNLASMLMPLAALPSNPASSAAKKASERYEFSLPRMGTLARIEIYTADESSATRAAAAVFERLEELEQILSDYRDDSELSV